MDMRGCVTPFHMETVCMGATRGRAVACRQGSPSRQLRRREGSPWGVYGELWDCMATAWSRTGQSSIGGSLGGVLGKGTFWFGRILDLMLVACHRLKDVKRDATALLQGFYAGKWPAASCR